MNAGIRIAAMSVILLCGGLAAEAYNFDANDFAAEVVRYIQGSGVGYDWIDFNEYNDPNTALGRPTLETTGDMDIGPEVPMVVVPVYPAWRSFEVVTVGAGGELVLRFNHRISDDKNNLHGVDFIVFGNSNWRIASGGSWGQNSNPETVTVSSTFYKEPGLVSVSQDGQAWYRFAEGPYADDFAPTAAYQWDEVNNVWAEELDPTQPLDPNLALGDFAGNTVAEIIDIYDGSGGGTGYDIKWLDANDYAALSVDPNSGRKWIQYVKIEDDPSGAGLPEIDAISDVSCCGDYRHDYPEGDLNEDCRVNLYDFAIVAAEANDVSDVKVIADNWLICVWKCE